MTVTVQTNDSSTPLRQDVKYLGNILGDVLQFHGGIELVDTVERIRKLTKDLRNNFDENTYSILKEEITSLKPPLRQQVIRAFSTYFHLVNIAEQNHRIRRWLDNLPAAAKM